MAVSVPSGATNIGRVDNIDSDSDYGSDFSVGEEQLVDQILARLVSDSNNNNNNNNNNNSSSSSNASFGATRHPSTPATTIAKQTYDSQPNVSSPATSPSAGGAASPRSARVLSINNNEATSSSHLAQCTVPLDSVQYPDLSSALSNLESDNQPARQPPLPTVEKEPDMRTPLQRFRTFPRRPLTVTDLAAGAWCELQHWYTLTRLPGGKKTVTPAMRGGSRLHQKLEDEVHTTVHVSIASKEEAFALRLWNIIQGLRTLRDTGKTRELEVWGTVEGEIFNGVIDQLSHESPNPSFEEERNRARLAVQQSSITDYISPSHKKVYITDVKTRGTDRLPSGVALRPARVQLFLYHRLLSNMATNEVDYDAVFKRYGLRSEARFSDAFMAQIGGLHDEVFYDADTEVENTPPETESPDLIGYRSISQIIPLLEAELRETFPHGSASIGDLVSVEYRHRDTERICGNNTFPNDPEALEYFIKHNLQWWRGDREPIGVCIEETYKCRWCEFAESCQWRKDKEVEFLNNRRRGRPNVSQA
ncbi:hypothetical protein F4803DRAFT_81785 [Xylaria telfairii]|nr:hypothetical protein F4803DRAFT_81785 [Xylaria telfairii]